MSLTVYGGPDDGRYSTRIVGSANSHGAERDADGAIHIVISPDRPRRAGRPVDPLGARRRGRHHPRLPRRPAAGTACRLAHRGGRSARDRTARTTPTWPGASGPPRPGSASRPASCPSRSARPTPSTRRTRCPPTTFGWAAGDAAYAMGAFELAEDEALVIRGRSPECVFWNMCLWNRAAPHLQLRLRTGDHQRRPGPVRARRLVDHRRVGHGVRPTPTGSPRPATARAASGSAGSCPRPTPEQPQVEVLPVDTV